MNELTKKLEELIEITWLLADDDCEPEITHDQEEKIIELLEKAKDILN